MTDQILCYDATAIMSKTVWVLTSTPEDDAQVRAALNDAKAAGDKPGTLPVGREPAEHLPWIDLADYVACYVDDGVPGWMLDLVQRAMEYAKPIVVRRVTQTDQTTAHERFFEARVSDYMKNLDRVHTYFDDFPGREVFMDLYKKIEKRIDEK